MGRKLQRHIRPGRGGENLGTPQKFVTTHGISRVKFMTANVRNSEKTPYHCMKSHRGSINGLTMTHRANSVPNPCQLRRLGAESLVKVNAPSRHSPKLSSSRRELHLNESCGIASPSDHIDCETAMRLAATAACGIRTTLSPYNHSVRSQSLTLTRSPRTKCSPRTPTETRT
jgi:hypothetical protein